MEKTLIQTALLDHNIFAHDQAMCGHLAQSRQHAADVFVGINKAEEVPGACSRYRAHSDPEIVHDGVLLQSL
jgi:hypothetical protein